MIDCTTAAQHHLPIDPQVPASARQMADEVAREHLKQDRQASERRAENANELARSVQGRISKLFGDDNYARFRHFLWKGRIEVRNQLLPPEGLTANARELHRARKDRANAFLAELGVAPERLGEVLSEGHKKWKDILRQHPLHGELEHAYPVAKFRELHGHLYDQVVNPPPDPPPDPHAFTVFRAPYAGWQTGWGFDPVSHGDFRGGHQDFIDPMAGLVGHEVTLDNDDASDFDFGVFRADAQIVFWYKPPATGIVDAVLEVQSLQAAHHLCTYDEWGWSESWTQQSNCLMMHVLHPNVAGPQLALVSNFDWETDESECVDRQFLPTGATFFTTLSSPGAVPAGQWVAIRAGTRSVAVSDTNDVGIHSSSRFQWLIKSVAVRIVP